MPWAVARNVIVVGKVVSGRVSRAGNVLLNLDKQYPNEIFTVFVKKEDLVNFGYDPVAF
jgi:endonuclease G